MKAWVQRLILVLAGLAAGFLITEGLAALILPAPHLRKEPTLRYRADPDCGYRHEPGQQAYTLSGGARINRWGFRGRDWGIEKPQGVYRIAVLGDSYIFGHGVDDESTLTQQLERLLNKTGGPQKFEVLNFGADGYDTGHEIRVLQHHVLKFKPDAVILVFYLNDLLYNDDYVGYAQLFSQPAPKKTLKSWAFDLARKSRVIMVLWDFYREKSSSEWAEVLKTHLQETVPEAGGSFGENWDFVLENLKTFSQTAVQQPFKPYLLILPTPQEVLEPQTPAAYVTYLAEKSRGQGVHPLVLREAFEGRPERPMEWLIPYDFHLSEAGNRLAAEWIAKEFQAGTQP